MMQHTAFQFLQDTGLVEGLDHAVESSVIKVGAVVHVLFKLVVGLGLVVVFADGAIKEIVARRFLVFAFCYVECWGDGSVRWGLDARDGVSALLSFCSE